MNGPSVRKAAGAALIILAAAIVYFSWWAAPGNAAAGEAVYKDHCLLCHALNGQPQFTAEKVSRTSIDSLTERDVQAKSNADLKKIIVEGDGHMPPVKGLSHREVVNVIAFIRSLKK